MLPGIYPLVVGVMLPSDGGRTGEAFEGAVYPVAALAVENEGAFAADAGKPLEFEAVTLIDPIPLAEPAKLVEAPLAEAVPPSTGALGGVEVGEVGGMIAANEGESDGIMKPLGRADAAEGVEARDDVAGGANGLVVVEGVVSGDAGEAIPRLDADSGCAVDEFSVTASGLGVIALAPNA